MIKLKGLNKTYDGRKSLNDINLEIPPGNVIALLGPNGSGKTTLIKCLLGLAKPDPGSEISIAGISSMGYMPQGPSYPANLTCRQIIAFLEDLYPADKKRKERLIAELGVSSFLQKRFSMLSQGMKQKLNILQCFMALHPVYILDEPTAAVDPLISVYVRSLIKEVTAAGSTFIFTTHIISEVKQIAERIVVLEDGRVINDKALADFPPPSDLVQGIDEFEATLIGIMK